MAKLKKFWAKIKNDNVGRSFNQVKMAKEEAGKLSACYVCLRPSCLKVLKDKNATEEARKNRKELCNTNSYKSRVNTPKVAETKIKEKKPFADTKVDGNVTQIQGPTEDDNLENQINHIYQTNLSSTPQMRNNDIKIEPFEHSANNEQISVDN